MILKGNQRAGGRQLAAHLMNVIDNDHVTVHEVRGFISNELHGAINETYAISRGTKCKQFLFSLSLNPPLDKNVSIDVFEDTLNRIERKLGLTNQPRAIVFHEKYNRRHAHAVWSRIDTNKMRAINLPHYKMKLQKISHELYQEHNWKMPDGFKQNTEPDRLNFSLEEWQQAKRSKRNPKEVKAIFQRCWVQSNDLESFAASLKRQGYLLAKGNRRVFVAVDQQLEVHSIARRVGIKNKEAIAKLGDPLILPSIEEAQELTKQEQVNSDNAIQAKVERQQKLQEEYEHARRATIIRHRQERADLFKRQEEQRIAENKIRAAKLPTGLKALWFRMTGKYSTIKLQNEQEAIATAIHHTREQDQLISSQAEILNTLEKDFHYEDSLTSIHNKMSQKRIL